MDPQKPRQALLLVLHDDVILAGQRSTGGGTQDTLPPPAEPLHLFFPLIGEQWVIGRESDCAIRIHARRKGVSRRHATIRRAGDQFTVEDHSSYGTYINGHVLRGPQILQPGDLIGLGIPQELLRFDVMPHDADLPSLTERELEVLRLLAAGRLNKEIAAELAIAHTTVNSHLKRIFEKLNAHNRTEAVRNARHLRIIP